MYANPTPIAFAAGQGDWSKGALALGAANLDPTISTRPLTVGGMSDSGAALLGNPTADFRSGAVLISADIDTRFPVSDHLVALALQPTIQPAIHADSTAEEIRRVGQHLEEADERIADLEDEVIRLSSQLEQSQALIRAGERRERQTNRRIAEEHKQRARLSGELARIEADQRELHDAVRLLRREFYQGGGSTYPIWPPPPDDDFDPTVN